MKERPTTAVRSCMMANSGLAPLPILHGALLAATLFGLAGCGPGLPNVYPVQGKVVNKGKGHVKDLAGYSVQFQSVAEPAEMPGGTIEQDGTFIMYTRVADKVIPGVKEGTYRACLRPPAVEGARPSLIIPSRYTKFETSKLEYTIAPGE